MKKPLLLFLLLVSFYFSNAQDYRTAIHNYFNTNRSQVSLTTEDTGDFEIKSASYSKSMQLDNVYVNQRIHGIEVFNSVSSFAIKNGEVKSASLGFVSNGIQKINTTSPAISAENAIALAASSFNLDEPSKLSLIETKTTNSFVYNTGSISLNNIPVSLVFQPMKDESLRLAWDLSIYLLDASHYYNVRIDAVSGDVLSMNDWVLNCNFGTTTHHKHSAKTSTNSVLYPQEEVNTIVNAVGGGPLYRVFPLPVESPNHGSEMLVIDPANPVASPFGWHDTNGADGPEFTITRGNNVIARDDLDGNNAGGISPDGGASLTFDFPYDFNTEPVNILSASSTNLFYWNNIVHDVFYQYGFDEASGNFQANNYGNGGTAGDFVDAQTQDGSGINNANFATPPDGNNPRMQMFLWNAPAPTPIINISAGTLSGMTYEGLSATFGDPFTNVALMGQIVLSEDNNAGASTDSADACDLILNGADLNGNIAIIRRGECEFGTKMLAVENEGAIAAIVVNNVDEPILSMGPGDVGDQVTIPSMMISQAEGEEMIAAIEGGETIDISVVLQETFQRDSAIDNGIVSHEYGHGISTRLTGGRFNVGCLNPCLEVDSNNQCVRFSEQVGEGWSDWFGLMLTMEEGDQREDIRGYATYASGQPINGRGIREAAYSTDFSINNFTYGRTNNQVSAPHGIGFVWATALWEMTWDLIEEYGYDPDIYNGTGGNNIAIQLVLDGLKLQPCSPVATESRDAILEADMLANGGANQCLIWAAFARRGYGVSADAGTFERDDQTEAFDVPTTPDCVLSVGDRGAIKSSFIIYPNPAKGIVNIQALEIMNDAKVSIYDINGRSILTQNISLQNTATVNIESLTSGIYMVEIIGDGHKDTVKLIVE